MCVRLLSHKEPVLKGIPPNSLTIDINQVKLIKNKTINQRMEDMGKKDRSKEHIADLIKEHLWTSDIHPARKYEPYVLYLELEKAVEERIVKKVYADESHELIIYCYTKKTELNPLEWKKIAFIAGGIVLRVTSPTTERPEQPKNVQILATPFVKFFNFYQDGILYDEIVEKAQCHLFWNITKKMDGSLGILFWDTEKWRITTKCAFQSELISWATKYLDRNVNLNCLDKGTTYMLEIISPKNKIVIDYPFEGLILLGAYDESGVEQSRLRLEWLVKYSRKNPSLLKGEKLHKKCSHLPACNNLGFQLVEYCCPDIYLGSSSHWQDYIESIQNSNGKKEEGVVVCFWLKNGASYRVKIKSNEYLLLAKNRVCDSKKILWACSHSNNDVYKLKILIPEKYHEEFDNEVHELWKKVNILIKDVCNNICMLKSKDCKTKKDVGLFLKDNNHWPNGKIINQKHTPLIYIGFDDPSVLKTGWISFRQEKAGNSLRFMLFQLASEIEL